MGVMSITGGADKETVIILDFGGQYNQLIARRVRECGVYCEVIPYSVPIERIRELNPRGIILTGGPNNVNDSDAPKADRALFEMGIPILGICYGAQLMAYTLGGSVLHAENGSLSEFGRAICEADTSAPILGDFGKTSSVWMSHTLYIADLPNGFVSIAKTDKCPNAVISCDEKKLYGIQFHPEVNHTENGTKIISAFLTKICGLSCNWNMKKYAETTITEIKDKVGNGNVLLALSGGVDSSVCCALFNKAVGNQLNCIFVDHGLMRKNEGDEVEAAFANKELNLIRVNAEQRFLERLKGVTDPETKRKIIGEEFIRVFEEESKKIGEVDYLVQGTIYPDVIESGIGNAAVIKSHHNVGGLPDCVDFKEILEPLRLLFKDEVRELGRELGLPDNLVSRQPFPGPGLAVRVIGEVTKEKLDILREADYIFREEISKVALDKTINQYFAVLTDMRSVGVMGDGRTYDYTLALRAVTTSDFMTADFARIPYEVLERVSSRIVNEVNNINRICYDITSKPPATIEWE